MLKNIWKNISSCFRWDNKNKFITLEWLEKSGLQKELEQQGFKFKLINPGQVTIFQKQGWEFVYQVDENLRITYKLILSNDNGNTIHAVPMKKPEGK